MGDHRPHHARQLSRGRRVLPPAHRRLTDKTRAPSRQLADRQAEARIIAQRVKVVGVLVAAGDRKGSCPQDVLQRVDHPRLIARVGNESRKLRTEPHLALGLCQQQRPAVGGQPAATEGGGGLLATSRWKRKHGRAVVAAFSGWPVAFLPRCRYGLSTHFLQTDNASGHAHDPFGQSSASNPG